MPDSDLAAVSRLDPLKFRDPAVTADGAPRATVALERLETLWFNTGTLCNIACRNCYIESSPRNDRLAYLSAEEAAAFLDEAETTAAGTREIGFTGGEPFMNRALPAMLGDALRRGYSVLVLTNAMKPMMQAKDALLDLVRAHGRRLGLRVSIDHYLPERHEGLRGPGSWQAMEDGFLWLARNGFDVAVAGRTRWPEPEAETRAGYARLFADWGVDLDAADPARLVLFPEMDAALDVPEITTACWGILGVRPDAQMCATSRMVVRRKDAPAPAVVACTLLPYDKQFELGPDLAAASRPVSLNHPHCARFCVLGGASCSVGNA